MNCHEIGRDDIRGLQERYSDAPRMPNMAGLARCLLTLSLVLNVTGGVARESGTPEPLTLDIPAPFDSESRLAECPFDADIVAQDLRPVFAYMQQGEAEAVACAAFLDANAPAWHEAEGAEELVRPLISFLLGDGTARGLQRHAVFVDLLGHLEKIAPDWRWSDEVRGLMPQIILASVVEDPFVANLWTLALEEMDPDWRRSEAAESLVPELYRLALEQARRPPGPRNQRPRELLKDLSKWSNFKLMLATRVYDTWPKRGLWLAFFLAGVVLVVYRQRRKRP